MKSVHISVTAPHHFVLVQIVRVNLPLQRLKRSADGWRTASLPAHCFGSEGFMFDLSLFRIRFHNTYTIRRPLMVHDLVKAYTKICSWKHFRLSWSKREREVGELKQLPWDLIHNMSSNMPSGRLAGKRVGDSRCNENVEKFNIVYLHILPKFDKKWYKTGKKIGEVPV